MTFEISFIFPKVNFILFSLVCMVNCSEVSANKEQSWKTVFLGKISDEKNGVVIFLNYNESQNNITSKLNHENITLKKSTDLRSYGIGSQILVDIGVSKMKLLAAPRKMPSMAGYGLQVTEFIENNI